MRVSQISVCHQPISYSQANNVKRNCPNPPCPESVSFNNVNFRGKFGAWVGGIIGTAAVVATAIVAAPAAICFTAGGAIAGAIGGHVVEDAVNKDSSDSDN